ncbi:uncharacterized protein LOC133746278 isoform X3 [Rosa rugosa]|uniref:uncharacterized protein LOC133717324 isoform X3 n=1 Tax=Rosa rugosa TaxID=74645 RepID=UPI002B40A064|nr:uncharacterized protein LOC133717324 isoform X3 [Rosa rugosa]XP_062030441.1 uncharacterized protein LOC133746278 isoform X3 [Rosa rugosa]
MSEHIECSKKASKRKKFLRRALVAASLNSGNAGIRIADEQTSDGDNQPNERVAQSEGVINKGKKSRKLHKGKEKSVVQDTDGIDEVISSNRRVNDTSAEVESNVEESHTERPQSAEPKKKRGPTTMGIIPEGQITRMNVTFNANGQPYGTNSDKFATVLGVLTRTHIPVTHPTWKDLDPTKKDDVWKLTQQYFIVDPVHKGMVYRMLGNYWRQYKCAVTKKILKANNCIQLLSEKFRKMRKKQEYTHTLSRMGYARLEHKMKKENPTEEVTRVKLWTKAHEKGGKPVNEVVGAILEGLKACNESQENPPSANSIRDDALARVLGPETRGRVRGLGFGTTPSRVNATIQGSAKVKELEATVLSQSQRLAQVEAKLEALLKATQEVPQQNRNLEQMINAHATTSQSQQSSRPINAPSNDLENRRCALLNWNNYEEDEVVAEGKISSTNPSTKVHCVPLGRDCWKVWVDVVFDKYQTMEVYRATMDAKQLGEAVGSTLAWPKSSIKMLP